MKVGGGGGGGGGSSQRRKKMSLRAVVIKQYHDDNGHMGVQKTFDCIRQKYFWPNLFKEIYQYVSSCTTCQTRSLQKIWQPLQEMDIPHYPMAKLSLDLSGPYPTTLSNNKYIIALLTGLVVGLRLLQSLIRQLILLHTCWLKRFPLDLVVLYRLWQIMGRKM